MNEAAVNCGIFTWFVYKRPFNEKLDLIKSAGFDAICSWWGDAFMELDGPAEDHVRLAREKGLVLENAHLPYHEQDLLWQDSAAGLEFEIKLKRELTQAARAEIPLLVIHPYRTRGILRWGDQDVFFQRARRLTEAAGQLGIKLAWENLYESRLLRSLLDHLADLPAAGFCFDSGHAHLSRDGALSLLADYPKKLFAIHLHDNDGQTDQHGLPGQGTFPWPVFMDLLMRTDYKGSLMLESCYPFDQEKADREQSHAYLEPDLPPQDYLATAVAVCRQLGLTHRV
ncbi:MAG: sugar phosphate isomerase/epimerase [Clostridiaceae bacterium]|nr:sugar phosphate isomerase/epimerase [Clostridiaceae bacterium]